MRRRTRQCESPTNSRPQPARPYRLGASSALLAAFLIIWTTGAVGIIGDEGDPANLMFLGVLAVALAGSVITGFRPTGMARAMYAASAAHVLVGAIAFFARLGASSPGWPWDIIASTFVFSTLWLISGALFRRAA